MRTLKLVGAKTYVGPRTENKMLKKGDTFDFKDEDAEQVLQEFQTDASNNAHPIFVDVTKAAPAAPATARVTRTRRAAV